MPLSLMECHSRGMLLDRVTGLRKINVFEPHRYSHQISGLVIEPIDERTARCRSNYLVIRTMAEGAMTIFSAGIYQDKVVLTPEGARFEERLVIQDSRRVETLLVIPL
jgi:anthranilate 1,2-dioxygenase small subunit